MLDIFSVRRYDLVTRLTPEECAVRLRARTMSLLRPLSWFASPSKVPFVGRVSPTRFALKSRHWLTRPTMLDQARGEMRRDGDVTRIAMRIGLSAFDRAFVIVWVAFVLVWSVVALLAPESSWSPSPQPRSVIIAFAVLMIGSLAFVTGLVRFIGRHDRVRLYDSVTSALEARPA